MKEEKEDHLVICRHNHCWLHSTANGISFRATDTQCLFPQHCWLQYVVWLLTCCVAVYCRSQDSGIV